MKGIRKQNKKRKISIRFKMLALLLAVMVLLCGAMAAIMYRNVRKALEKEAGIEMNLFCRDRGMEINSQLLRIEDSVTSVSQWFLRQMEASDSLEKMTRSRLYRNRLLEQAKSMLLLSAKRIDGAETIYFRFALDLIDDSEEGVFYVRGRDGEFRKEPLTQIREYEKDDMEHVGWYYLPVEKGAPMWMPPYHNKNINVTMISYEEPVYLGSTLIGLVGIDIDFSRLLEEIMDIQYKETGYMYLKAADGSIHYHPDYLKGEDLHGDEQDEIISGQEEMAKDSSENLVRYHFRGAERVMVFTSLRNGMKIVLCDSYQDIFRVVDETLTDQMLIAAVLFAAAAFALILISNHITRPLTKLAEAAGQLSQGNYDVELPGETSDEVGDLTRAFRTAVEHLKQYADDMEILAYQDALTRVKNVAAYRIEQSALNETIEKGHACFAVLMLDLNYLKQTNDRYGHSAGDILLMRLASVICRTFPLSAVYRIGGDEFTVVLKDTEYECREAKLTELEQRIRANNEQAQEEYMRISVAWGLAEYEKDQDRSFEEVYRKADRSMYQMKQRMHE